MTMTTQPSLETEQITVFAVTDGFSSYVTEDIDHAIMTVVQSRDDLEAGEISLTIEPRKMSRADFEALPEFDGF